MIAASANDDKRLQIFDQVISCSHGTIPGGVCKP